MTGRVLFFLFVLLPYMVLAGPLQFLLIRFDLPFSGLVPRGFHRLACLFLGLRVSVLGKPKHGQPVLLVSNHIAWTDIIAIGSVADVSFVAKSDIARWPLVGFIASLQKTIYVDRTRRHDTGRALSEMVRRLAAGGTIVLFAEGQSDIGTHVLPFRSALVGAAQAAMVEFGARNVVVQPMAIAYTRVQGLPISRNERAMIAWNKSKSVRQNIIEILTGPVKDITIAFGEPRPLTETDNRKRVTRACESEVRHMLVTLNRGGTLPSLAL